METIYPLIIQVHKVMQGVIQSNQSVKPIITDIYVCLVRNIKSHGIEKLARPKLVS